jgi:hypothetical protein
MRGVISMETGLRRSSDPDELRGMLEEGKGLSQVQRQVR